MTYQMHNTSDRSLDVDALVSVDSDQAALASDERERDERSVVDHSGLDVLQPVG